MQIGTRTVFLKDPRSGHAEAVSLSINLFLTHGEPWRDDPCNITGQVDIAGDGWEMALKTYAADEIQAVGRLVKLAGAALLGSCDRDGRELCTPDRTEALKDPLELF